MNLRQFLNSGQRNAWVNAPYIKVYVRRGLHRLNELGPQQCLDIGNVEVVRTKRGTGVFTRWLTHAEKLAAADGLFVYVECVLESRLIRFLKNRGYRLIQQSGPDLCYYFDPNVGHVE